MNIREANGHYERHTTTLSTVSRQSAFAGIAVAWTFRATAGGGHLQGALAWAAGFYVIALMVDIAQYAVLSARWQAFISKKRDELHAKHDDDLPAKLAETFTIPSEVNRAGIWAFWAKFAFYAAGHVALLFRLVGLVSS
jgi:hypothetical protein